MSGASIESFDPDGRSGRLEITRNLRARQVKTGEGPTPDELEIIKDTADRLLEGLLARESAED